VHAHVSFTIVAFGLVFLCKATLRIDDDTDKCGQCVRHVGGGFVNDRSKCNDIVERRCRRRWGSW
jgi:hypothetical protein